jgi:hypothetical protein
VSGEAYTEGNSERDWIAKFIEVFREARFPHIPDLDAFEKSNQGVYSVPVTEPEIAFADFRKDPASILCPRPPERLRSFHKRLFDMKKPGRDPRCPQIYHRMGESLWEGSAKISPAGHWSALHAPRAFHNG